VTRDQQAVFGEALRRAREEQGLSLRDLAGLVGASHSVIAQWERGEHFPRPPRVIMIEHVLRLSPGSLSRLLGYVPVTEANGQPPVSTLEAARLDPRLGDRERAILTVVYQELVRQRELELERK
jgi:transcriptional regulator with XRE-family HTH domain